ASVSFERAHSIRLKAGRGCDTLWPKSIGCQAKLAASVGYLWGVEQNRIRERARREHYGRRQMVLSMLSPAVPGATFCQFSSCSLFVSKTLPVLSYSITVLTRS